MKWYKAWHETRWYHAFHTFVLIVLCLSLFSNFLPTSTLAALNTKTISKSSLADFAEGSLDDLLNENDALSMHLGKKVNTGNTSTKEDLNSYSGRSITRTSDGRIHIVWVKKEVTPKIIYHSSSIDEGSTWEVPNEVAADQNATGVLTKVDGNNNVHIFWAVANPGKTIIKHRIKGSDGFFGAVMVVPTNELDGAVADWQAIPQGDHYGNYYDTVTGGLATVTRPTPKTIYDSQAEKIHDVPAGYLGVKTRSDGNLGYEAEIEEGRSNYLLNSYGNDNNGTSWNSWTQGVPFCSGSAVKSIVSGVYGTTAQRYQYNAVAGDTVGQMQISHPSVGGFTAGETATASFWVKGTSAGVATYIYAQSFQDDTYLNTASQAFTLTSSWQRVSVVYPNLPSGTNRVGMRLQVSSIAEGDSIDITLDAAQLEKGSFTTSYIPTTTTAVERGADGVTIPTTNWNEGAGTWLGVFGPHSYVTTAGLLHWQRDANNYHSAYVTGGGNTFVMRNQNVNPYYDLKAKTGTFVGAGRYGAGEATKAFVNGLPGTRNDILPAAPSGLPATAFVGSYGGYSFYNGTIGRIVIYPSSLSDIKIGSLSTALMAGTEEALTQNPVADWQAIQQGDHYGNYYDSVTSGLATVTRSTPKTIYDPTTNKIYDVPANYIGVRPRSDGKPGNEAEIEEGRTNYLLNSYGASNSSNKWSNWTIPTDAQIVPSIVPGVYKNTAQRIEITTTTGIAYNTMEFPSSISDVGTFAAGEKATATAYIKGTFTEGASLSLHIYARDAAATVLGSATVAVTPTSDFTRVTVTYASLPAGTSRCNVKVVLANMTVGRNADITVDAAQLEKGAFATSYIPTTTAQYSRSADKVDLPTNAWSESTGTFLADISTTANSVYGGILDWRQPNNGGDNLVNIYRASTGTYYFQSRASAQPNTQALSPNGSAPGISAYVFGNNKASAFLNGTPGAVVTPWIPPSGMATTAILGRADYYTTRFNGPISRFIVYSNSFSSANVAILTQELENFEGGNEAGPSIPSVDTSNNVHFLFSKNDGVGYRSWNGSSWTSTNTSLVVSGVGEHTNSNTLSIGSNLYYFYTLTSNSKRYFISRTNGNWTSPLLVSDFISTDSIEIVDSEGNIQIFTTDESLTDTVIKYKKYNVIGNSFSTWSTLDSQASVDVNHPSATISSNGNIWVYYNVGTDIYYKIFNKVAGSWGARVGYTVKNATTWVDLSGNGNNATLNEFNFNTDSGWSGDGSSNNPYSVKFDAVNDNITVSGDSSNVSERTYDFWVANTQLLSPMTVFNHGSAGTGAFHLAYGASNKPILYLGTENYRYWTAFSNVADGNFHHYSLYYSGNQQEGISSAKLHIDGVLVAVSSTVNSGPQNNWLTSLSIGNKLGTSLKSVEKMTSFRIYNRSLTEAELIQNYTAGNAALNGYVKNGLTLDLNAALVDGFSHTSGGPTFYPKVRYQENFHYFPDKIDLLYRQNPTGDTSSYNLYYGTVGSDTTGTYTSPESGNNVLSTNWIGGWGDPALSSNVNILDGTAINYELRTGNGPDKNTITWGSWTQTARVDSSTGTGNRLFTVAAANMPALNLGTEKYLQIRISLISENGTNVPTLYDYSLNYLADENAPTWDYPVSVPAFTDATKNTPITHDTWSGNNTNSTIFLDWAGATDGVNESGISNYYVYFGPDSTANPLTGGVDKGTVTDGLVSIASPISGTTYYLRVAVKDVAGNILNLPSGQSLFTYKFDNEKPKSPTNYSVSPVGWSTANSFNFTWSAAIDPGSGSSNIKGYEYKRAGGDNNWTYIDAAPSITISDITSYQDGQNDFYIRSVDFAGNNSGDEITNWTVVHYYFNGSAPSKPTALTVSPQQSVTNSFVFNWEEPETHNSPIKGYYYSINSIPNINNTVFTTDLTTGVIPAATQQGINDFYVVAVDTNDVVGWATPEHIQFECNTTAPGIPGGLVVSDSSNLTANDWALTIKWQTPSEGAVSNYFVYGSTDGINYTNIAETASTGYLDSGLASTSTYYYKVTAVDNAGAESAFSSTVSKQPTGKFAEPPIIVSGPEVKATASSAVITWTTNRASSSFITTSKTEDYLGSIGQLDNVTSHRVVATGLEPGTTYNYKVQSFDENRDYQTEDSYSIPYSFTTQSAPGISEVSITDIRLTSAIITWKTTTVATSKILFGKTNEYGQMIEDSSGSSVTTHTVKLDNLDHSSLYHAKIFGTDIDGNQLVSDDYSFETLTFPKVSDIKFEQQKNTATSTLKVVWNSNVPTASVIEYAEEGGTFREISKSTLETKHSLMVSGLKDNTTYKMVIKGRDAYGNEAVSDIHTVRTDFDTRPPELVNITSETTISGYGLDTKAQIVVYWETDEASTSQIEYATGVMGETYSYKTQEDTSLTTSHVVIISDLKPSTSYHFRAISKDGSKNEGFSEDNSVLTEQAQASVLDMVISTLQNALGWLFGV